MCLQFEAEELFIISISPIIKYCEVPKIYKRIVINLKEHLNLWYFKLFVIGKVALEALNKQLKYNLNNLKLSSLYIVFKKIVFYYKVSFQM